MITILGFGSRTWISDALVTMSLAPGMNQPPQRIEFVHGGAKGADVKMAAYARSQGWAVRVFRPDYSKFDPSEAPLRRNDQMAAFCLRRKGLGHEVYAVGLWKDHSYGSLYMMNRWKKYLGEGTMTLWYDCDCHDYIGLAKKERAL